MAIDVTQKVDFLLKKVGYELGKTAADTLKGPANEIVSSPITISSQNLWLDAIPTDSSVPSSSVEAFFIKLTNDNTAPTNRTWIAASNKKEWISKSYGNYGVRVWIADATSPETNSGSLTNSTELQPAGGANNDGFFVDFIAGIIHFADTNIPASFSTGNTKAIFVQGWRYIGAKGSTDTARKSSDLTQFANTSAANLRNKITETTGSGALVFQSGALLHSPVVTGGINVSGDATFYNNVNVTGTLTVKGGTISLETSNVSALNLSATSGNFVSALTVGGVPVSLSGHSHVSSDITDFTESVQDVLGTGNKTTTGFLRNGSGLAWTYNDNSNTLSVGVTGIDLSLINGLDTYFNSNLNTSLVQSTGIGLTYNSTNSQLSIAVTGISSSLVTDFNTSTDNRINSAIENKVKAGSGINLSYNTTNKELTVNSNITGTNGVQVTHDGSNNRYTISLNDPTIQLADITDLSGLAKTFLLDSTSANLRGLVTDETGTGKLVFADNPTLSGVSISGNLTVDKNVTVGGNITLTGSGLKASNIDDFNTAVRSNSLDQLAAPTGDVSFNNKKITSLADPTDSQDAATKAYVDAVRTGLDVKASVRVATTGNITLVGAQTIDGVSVSAGNRILVKNQTNKTQNGIYLVATGPWSRTPDADNLTPAGEVTAGMFTFVEEGTTNADTGWLLSTNDNIILGTTDLDFVQFSAAGQITAGSGLSKSGNEINIGSGPSGTITISADHIELTSIAPDTINDSNGVSTFVKTVNVDTFGRVTEVRTAPVIGSLTVGTTTLNLGGSVNTLTGLTGFSATNITGTLDGNAATATTATNANNIEVDADNTTAINYLVFVNNTDGNLKPKVQTALRFNAATSGLIGSDTTTPKTTLQYFIIDGGTP